MIGQRGTWSQSYKTNFDKKCPQFLARALYFNVDLLQQKKYQKEIQ